MTTATAPAPARSGVIKPGDAAPDFTLPDQNRKDWNLAEHVKQGDVVLAFFPFAFTGTCGTEMSCITKDLADWTKKGATVVGISCDSMFASKAWAEQMGLKHTILSDLHRNVVKQYGLYWPEMNVGKRGTVIIGKSADGRGKVKWSEGREPGNAMNWDEILQRIS